MIKKIRDLVRGMLGVYLIEQRLADIRDALGEAGQARPGTAKRGALDSLADEVRSRLRALEASVEPDAAVLKVPKWWERSYWEPTVALAIRDHCRPGDIAFDVGANAGALAIMMSRLVGPKGVVCAFEASPRIIDKTRYNIMHNACHNITLFHKAVWHSSGERVNIAAGSHLNDSIGDAASGMSVSTIALDDFAESVQLFPAFIKMDIEGAEFDALQGMTRLLRQTRPVLVLEQSPTDMRCHDILSAEGYRAVDLATYARIHTRDDFRAATGVANVLFVPQEATASNPYFADAAPVPVATLGADLFRTDARGNIALREPLLLGVGRYIVQADFTADGTDNEIFAGVDTEDETIFRYHTFTAFMASSYRDWVIQLDRPAGIRPFLRFLAGADPTLRWRGATVSRLPAFDGLASPLTQ